MKPTAFQPSTLTAGSTIAAAIAAIALTACDPKDATDAVAAPQPAYPAQSSYPAAPAPNAYAPQPNYVADRPVAPSAGDQGHIGSVASIEPIRERRQGSGAGAVIGGVLERSQIGGLQVGDRVRVDAGSFRRV